MVFLPSHPIHPISFQSAAFQMVMTVVNLVVLTVVAAAGTWVGVTHGWPGYQQASRYGFLLPRGLGPR